MPHPQQPLGGSGFCDPRLVAFHDGVCVDEQLSSAGDHGDLVRFARGGEPLIETNENLVPLEGGRQRCCIEASAQAFSSSKDTT